MAVVTALTVQGPRGVERVAPVAPDLVADQLSVLFRDVPPAAAKVGMLGTRGNVQAVADALCRWNGPFVLDPVLRSSSGAALLDEGGLDLLRDLLVPLALLTTPNEDEVEALLGRGVSGRDVESVAADLLALGARHVLWKGGHRPGKGPVVDLLISPSRIVTIAGPRLTAAHGTGCRLAAALAVGFARGLDVEAAARAARRIVARGLRHPWVPTVGRPAIGF